VLRGAPTASRRQSGRAGRNAASGRNVGQVCANGAATELHHWFSWAALTKCRCSEIVLGEASTRYGKLLTKQGRLTRGIGLAAQRGHSGPSHAPTARHRAQPRSFIAVSSTGPRPPRAPTPAETPRAARGRRQRGNAFDHVPPKPCCCTAPAAAATRWRPRSRRARAGALAPGCFEIPDRFVIGFGLDHNQLYRNLSYVAVMKPDKSA
jgi:hypothetical protein